MDCFTITTDCIELGNTISRTTLVLNEFVREVREARSDLDAVSRELHSLQGVLNLLKDDAPNLPSKIAAQTPAILQQCNVIVDELDTSLLALDSPELSRPEKRTRWISEGKPHIADLRDALEAHRTTVGLALDLVGATCGRNLHDNPDGGYFEDLDNVRQQTEVRGEAIRIIEEMGQLQFRLPEEFESDGTEQNLQTYFSALKTYADSLIIADLENGAYIGSGPSFGAYVGDEPEGTAREASQGPDSAIGVSDVESSSSKAAKATSGEKSVRKSSEEQIPTHAEPYVTEVNTLMEEMMTEDGSSRAPSRVPSRTPSRAPSRTLSRTPSRAPTPPPKDAKRLDKRRKTMVTPFASFEMAPEEAFGVVTEITSNGNNLKSQGSNSKSPRFGSFSVGRLIGHVRNAISESSSSKDDLTSMLDDNMRPSTPIIQASLVRRGSRRLSTSIKKLPLWTTELEDPEGPSSPGSNAVFGVSLAKSMQAAKSTAKTHHSGSGSGSSRREFPLCIHKCCGFLQKEGVEAPDIFAEPGDGYRVQKLKETFSRAPKYGEDVNWDNYGVYDAADIIMLFLSQLPKPLISESVAKRWISLSRQATQSGSSSTRTDQCIDFWEEALGGLRGPSRGIFKLLLNLWSSIADAAEKNDMTAERLAGTVLKPLMHTSSEKYSTDYMLGLAFLIRKRSEYTTMLNEGRPSRAAF
ncbi:hypothetical protein PG993_002414 [Apiospora rasikravindrae]|uniref:Rho-GAP domain-containing protein n=1 Tax=Apiospora rasikravindrae TaxID=990691 RepID=A0ABR1TWK5_9PEZI